MNELIQQLENAIEIIESVCRYGDGCDHIYASELASDCLLAAGRLGFPSSKKLRCPREALAKLGRALAWVRQIPPPLLMTTDETIVYLRLDSDGRDPAERLRKLIRRQRLPVVRKGRLQLFKRAAVDEWLQARK